MKKMLFQIIIGLAIFYLAQGAIVNAAPLEKPCSDSDVNCWISQLQSKKLHDRERAVGRLEILYYHDKSEVAKDAIIDFLEKEAEQKFVNGAFVTDNEGEGEAEFFYRLCKVVGRTTDPRAIPIILRIGNLEALEPYGETVLDVIISRLEDKNAGPRGAAATVLDDFLTPKEEGYNPQGEAREKIRKALLKAVKNDANKKELFERAVRGRMIKALGNFQDDEVVAVLEEIKKNDFDGPNRDKAEHALEKIKKAKEEKTKQQ